jgi:hypothetical protein
MVLDQVSKMLCVRSSAVGCDDTATNEQYHRLFLAVANTVTYIPNFTVVTFSFSSCCSPQQQDVRVIARCSLLAFQARARSSLQPLRQWCSSPYPVIPSSDLHPVVSVSHVASQHPPLLQQGLQWTTTLANIFITYDR